MEDINLEYLYRLKLKGAREVTKWCMNEGIITCFYKCCKCGKQMKLIERKDVSDGFEWRCRIRGQHDIRRSVRKGSWFGESKLQMIQIMILTYMWVQKLSNETIMDEMRIGSATVVAWKAYCREVCVEMCERDSDVLGGEGVTVEIDESKFGKNKCVKGKRINGEWVFGGIERGSNKCFMEIVEKRDKKTLLGMIQKYIKPGTTLVSDCWRTYECLEDESFQNLTVNHSLHFEHPENTGVSTGITSIEGMWEQVKKGLAGTNHVKDRLDSYLAEYMWRRKHVCTSGATKFSTFLHHVAEIYPPDHEDANTA